MGTGYFRYPSLFRYMKNKNSILFTLLVVLALFGCTDKQPAVVVKINTTYFVDSKTGDDASEGTKTSAPWKTLAKLSGLSLNAGDSVKFASGSTFAGGCTIESSATKGHPIVMTSYGFGDQPIFSNPDYSLLNGNVFQVKGSHVTIDGLHFEKCVNSPGKVDKDILSVGAVYGVTGSDFLTVKNCLFVDCPIGVYANGQHALITKNILRDCNRFLSEPDWGPIGIVIGNAYSDVSYNSCTNYVKVGGNYGADGGFIELEDRYFGNKVHHVNIHHNTSIANQGFLEIESKVTGDSLNVYYNFSDDYQQFIFYWGGNHSKVDNNTVIRTRPSNHGSVNTVFTMRNADFSLKNNIFLVANGIQVLVTAPYNVGNYAKVIHESNIYYCLDASTADPCGKPLGASEQIINPQFLNIANSDYHLNANSPAIKAGQRLGYSTDLENKILSKNTAPDFGAYQLR